jgi:hypothetical protein
VGPKEKGREQPFKMSVRRRIEKVGWTKGKINEEVLRMAKK